MNLRVIAPLLLIPLTTQALAGCIPVTLEVSPSEVPCLRAGSVYQIGGSQTTIRDDYSVRLVPHDGAVFMRDRKSASIIAVPERDVNLELARSLQPVSGLEGPIRSTLTDGYITALNGDFRVPVGSVKTILVKQLSPGRTVAAAIGIPLASAAVVAVIALAIVGLTNIGFSTVR